MLRATGAGAQVVVCSTCRPPAGGLLAERLRQLCQADPAAGLVSIETMRCLFACARGCAVHIRQSGKIGYVLGDFAPDGTAAAAIIAYAVAYAQSTDGEVAYELWPEGVKGHFIVRVPPDGGVVA